MAKKRSKLRSMGSGKTGKRGMVGDWVATRSNTSASTSGSDNSPKLSSSVSSVNSSSELSNKLLQKISNSIDSNSAILTGISSSLKVMQQIASMERDAQYLQKRTNHTERKYQQKFNTEDSKLQTTNNLQGATGILMSMKQWRMDTKAYYGDDRGRKTIHEDQIKAEATRNSIEQSDYSRNEILQGIKVALKNGNAAGGQGKGSKIKGAASKLWQRVRPGTSTEDEERESNAKRADRKQEQRTTPDGEDLGRDNSNYIISRNYDPQAEELSFVGPAAPSRKFKGKHGAMSDGDVIRSNDRAETYQRNIGFMKNQDAQHKEDTGETYSAEVEREFRRLDGSDTDSEIKNAIVDSKTALFDGISYLGDMADRVWDQGKRDRALDAKIQKAKERKEYLERVQKLEAGKMGIGGKHSKDFGDIAKLTAILKDLGTKRKRTSKYSGGLMGGVKSIAKGLFGGLVGGAGALMMGKGLKGAATTAGEQSGVTKKYNEVKESAKRKYSSMKDSASKMKDSVSKKASDVNKWSNKKGSAQNLFKQGVNRQASNAKDGASKWWNKGRDSKTNMKDLGGKETNASLKKLLANDKKQMTRSDKSFKAGGKGIKGLNPFKAFSPKMLSTGPSPLMRQSVERPVKKAMRFGEELKKDGGRGMAKRSYAGTKDWAQKGGVQRAGRKGANFAKKGAGMVAGGAKKGAGMVARGAGMVGRLAVGALGTTGAAVLAGAAAVAAVGIGGYMLWDKMRGTDDAKKSFDACVKAGLVDHDVIGNSEILDWEGIKKLKKKALKDLIDYDDWSSEDMKKLKEIQKFGEIDDKIKKKKVVIKEEKTLARKVNRRANSSMGQFTMMKTDDDEVHMTELTKGGMRERNELRTKKGGKRMSSEERNNYANKTAKDVEDSQSELKILEAEKKKLGKEIAGSGAGGMLNSKPTKKKGFSLANAWDNSPLGMASNALGFTTSESDKESQPKKKGGKKGGKKGEKTGERRGSILDYSEKEFMALSPEDQSYFGVDFPGDTDEYNDARSEAQLEQKVAKKSESGGGEYTRTTMKSERRLVAGEEVGEELTEQQYGALSASQSMGNPIAPDDLKKMEAYKNKPKPKPKIASKSKPTKSGPSLWDKAWDISAVGMASNALGFTTSESDKEKGSKSAPKRKSKQDAFADAQLAESNTSNAMDAFAKKNANARMVANEDDFMGGEDYADPELQKEYEKLSGAKYDAKKVVEAQLKAERNSITGHEDDADDRPWMNKLSRQQKEMEHLGLRRTSGANLNFQMNAQATENLSGGKTSPKRKPKSKSDSSIWDNAWDDSIVGTASNALGLTTSESDKRDNKAAEHLKGGQQATGVSGQNSANTIGISNVTNRGGDTSQVTNNIVYPQGQQRPSGMNHSFNNAEW